MCLLWIKLIRIFSRPILVPIDLQRGIIFTSGLHDKNPEKMIKLTQSTDSRMFHVNVNQKSKFVTLICWYQLKVYNSTFWWLFQYNNIYYRWIEHGIARVDYRDSTIKERRQPQKRPKNEFKKMVSMKMMKPVIRLVMKLMVKLSIELAVELV